MAERRTLHALHDRARAGERLISGQALVEFALVMPLLTVIFAVLLQFGILFMVYLNLVHLSRDVGRWLVVHPDSTDAEVQAYIQSNLPAGLVWSNFSFDFSSPDPADWPWSPRCQARDSNGRCASRPSGARQVIALKYDATSHVLLPTTLGTGYWRIQVPWGVARYELHMMVEQR